MEELKEGLDSLWESMDRNFAAFEKAEKLRHDILVAKLDSMIANTKTSTLA
jgi:hypothetical protein